MPACFCRTSLLGMVLVAACATPPPPQEHRNVAVAEGADALSPIERCRRFTNAPRTDAEAPLWLERQPTADLDDVCPLLAEEGVLAAGDLLELWHPVVLPSVFVQTDQLFGAVGSPASPLGLNVRLARVAGRWQIATRVETYEGAALDAVTPSAAATALRTLRQNGWNVLDATTEFDCGQRHVLGRPETPWRASFITSTSNELSRAPPTTVLIVGLSGACGRSEWRIDSMVVYIGPDGILGSRRQTGII